MSVESVYLVSTETLVFLLIVGGMMSLIIEDWQSEYAGFVIFFYSNVVSAIVLWVCSFAASGRFLQQAVLVAARGAVIFNVVVLCSFFMTATEFRTERSNSTTADPHVLHPLLFKASYDDGSAKTVAYLVIGISLCGILAILHVFLYHQLQGTFAELRGEAHAKMYACISAVVAAMEDSDAEDEAQPDDAKVQKILRLFSKARAEDRTMDSDSFMNLFRVSVRTFLLALCVLYDTKACMEGSRSGFLEVIPSLGFISFLALTDSLLLAHTNQPVGSLWRILVVILSVLLGLTYCGDVVLTLVFYTAERSSDVLSDTRRTFLNVVLVGLLTLDAVLHVVSVCLLALPQPAPHRETAAEDTASGGGTVVGEGVETAAGAHDDDIREDHDTSEAGHKVSALGGSVVLHPSIVLRVDNLNGDHKTTTFQEVDQDKPTTFERVQQTSMGSAYSGLLGNVRTGKNALDVLVTNKKNK
jgi:hypothetical protein